MIYLNMTLWSARCALLSRDECRRKGFQEGARRGAAARETGRGVAREEPLEALEAADTEPSLEGGGRAAAGGSCGGINIKISLPPSRFYEIFYNELQWCYKIFISLWV